ncbi:MAG: hypothetical protein JO076_17200 [Verrucomicrobia bacterium]|nr:hypothetical protein [Verrucomicrobiota bacterium]
MTRYIRGIYAPSVGARWSNEDMFAAIAERFEKSEIAEAKKTSLLEFNRLLLIGNRDRYVQHERFLWMDSFAEHAAAFEASVEQSIAKICKELEANPPSQPFDAVLGVSNGGQILPGIAERTASRLKQLVARTAIQIDIGNGGCTASTRAIQLAGNFVPEIQNILVIAIEAASTLADPKSESRSNWQGVCTFGDGAAAVWISDQADEGSVSLQKLVSWMGEERDLIRWDWGNDYYRFAIDDLSQFETKVRHEISDAMKELPAGEYGKASWAIHPAGIMLLLSLAKHLGLQRSALDPSIRHFRACSNMSSVSILHILKEVISKAVAGQQIRWLTMGAGFQVASGMGTKL